MKTLKITIGNKEYKKIYADEIRYTDNNSKVECPNCGCKMAFILEVPLNKVKLLKVGEE
jgi:hypothetical protein